MPPAIIFETAISGLKWRLMARQQKYLHICAEPLVEKPSVKHPCNSILFATRSCFDGRTDENITR